MKLLPGFALVLALALSGLAACSAGDDTPVPQLREGSVSVMSREQNLLEVSAPAPIRLGKNDLAVVPGRAGAELVDASALMPAHGHGTRPPTIERTAEGYRVRDLILYMSGRWEVRFSLREGGRDDEALLVVDVP